MTSITKAELAFELTEKLGLTNRESKEIVDILFEEICVALERGEDVKLSGFGNLVLRYKKERPGRNPKTGEQKLVSARRVVTFRPGQKLKTRLEQTKHK
jgi:integration host factor subunit alpha